jgi:hypothetical protein
VRRQLLSKVTPLTVSQLDARSILLRAGTALPSHFPLAQDEELASLFRESLAARVPISGTTYGRGAGVGRGRATGEGLTVAVAVGVGDGGG